MISPIPFIHELSMIKAELSGPKILKVYGTVSWASLYIILGIVLILVFMSYLGD